MTNKKQNRIANTLSLILNALVVILVIFSVIKFYLGDKNLSVPILGTECFRYFTVDSNILCALTCLVVIFFNIKGKGIPKGVLKFKLVGTVAVTITFVTVMVFLGPIKGFDKMVEGCNFFLHITNPIFAMISFMFLEGRLQTREIWLNKSNRTPITKKESLLGIIPSAIYGGLYGYMVLYTKWWDDFYGFNSGMLEGKWYISILGMTVMAILTCLVVRGIHVAFVKER